MPIKKQPFTIIKDKLVQAVDVDDSRGRSVPINMNYVEEGYLAKDTGCDLFGVASTDKTHSLFVYKKKDGTKYRIRAAGEHLQSETAGVWSNIKRGDVTMTIASPAVVTLTSHGLVSGSPISFTTTGALPTGVVAGTKYYVIATGLTANAFQFSATVGGAAINSSGTQSGTHSVYSRYTADAEFGYIVYDNILYFGNAVENYTHFNGTLFTEIAALPKGNIYEIFEDRLFITGVTAEPLTVYYSNAGVPTTFTPTDVVKPLDTDHTTGLVNYFGSLLIFKEESIWKLTFIYDQVVSLFIPKLESQNRNYGAVGRKCISWVENDVWFFNGREIRSIGFKDQQIGVLGVNNSVLSEPIKETLAYLTVANYTKVTTFYYNRRFFLSLPLTGTENGTTFVCHLLHGNNWTKSTSRIKAQINSMVEDDGVIYSSKSQTPYGTLQWTTGLNDNAVAIPSTVTLKAIEDEDFSRVNVYRYLDLMFKDLKARVTTTLKQDANDFRIAKTKTFIVGLDVEDEENAIGEVPVGRMLVGDSFGEVQLTSPFLKRRISFLSKAQALTIELSNNQTDETFTIAQFALSGHKNPRKQFSSKNIISIG
jgi:hypothetical protein